MDHLNWVQMNFGNLSKGIESDDENIVAYDPATARKKRSSYQR